MRLLWTVCLQVDFVCLQRRMPRRRVEGRTQKSVVGETGHAGDVVRYIARTCDDKAVQARTGRLWPGFFSRSCIRQTLRPVWNRRPLRRTHRRTALSREHQVAKGRHMVDKRTKEAPITHDVWPHRHALIQSRRPRSRGSITTGRIARIFSCAKRGCSGLIRTFHSSSASALGTSSASDSLPSAQRSPTSRMERE